MFQKKSERDRLPLTRKSKILILFKTLNNFSLTLKSLSHDNKIINIK